MNYVWFLIVLVLSVLIVIGYKRIEKIVLILIQQKRIEKFAEYVTVIEYHMEKAYEIIHKDKILIYSIEATRISDQEFNDIAKQFIQLVLKLMGSKLVDEVTNLYNEETLYFNISEYFNRRYEEDEIRKSSLDNLTSGED